VPWDTDVLGHPFTLSELQGQFRTRLLSEAILKTTPLATNYEIETRIGPQGLVRTAFNIMERRYHPSQTKIEDHLKVTCEEGTTPNACRLLLPTSVFVLAKKRL
jgi:hypothetical protein